jgi:hypothetical protein
MILTLLELLRVESNPILKYKIRVGPEHDGGYVLIDNIRHINTMYSFHDVLPTVYPFENEFVKLTNSTVHFCNHTFLYQALVDNNNVGNINMILKIDRRDLSFLLNTPDDVLLAFEQIVLTLHGVTTDTVKNIQILEKLNRLYHVIHVHANNNYPSCNSKYLNNIPDTVELTLIRKTSYTLYDNPVNSIYQFSVGNVDSPNNPLKPDIPLKFYPFKDYYLSLSTIPSRMHNISKVIESLLQQVIKPKKIFLHIPRVYRRFPTATIVLPDVSQYPNVEIVRCGDYGSATKFLPMMFIDEVKADENIIIVDDDHLYDPLLSVKLIDLTERYANSASCMFGVTNALYFKDRSWNTVSNTQKLLPSGFRGHQEGYIDVFEGFGGVCLQKRFFTDDVLYFPLSDIYAHDDIWFSANVLKNGFRIVVSGETVANKPFQDKVDALCLDSQTFMKSANLMKYLQTYFKIYC